MSGRFAHRPRYRMTRPLSQPSSHSRKEFFRTRWTYRRQHTPYQKRILGQGILFTPVYRFVHSVLLR